MTKPSVIPLANTPHGNRLVSPWVGPRGFSHPPWREPPRLDGGVNGGRPRARNPALRPEPIAPNSSHRPSPRAPRPTSRPACCSLNPRPRARQAPTPGLRPESPVPDPSPFAPSPSPSHIDLPRCPQPLALGPSLSTPSTPALHSTLAPVPATHSPTPGLRPDSPGPDHSPFAPSPPPSHVDLPRCPKPLALAPSPPTSRPRPSPPTSRPRPPASAKAFGTSIISAASTFMFFFLPRGMEWNYSWKILADKTKTGLSLETTLAPFPGKNPVHASAEALYTPQCLLGRPEPILRR